MGSIQAAMLSDNTIADRTYIRKETLERFERNITITARDPNVLRGKLVNPMTRILREAGQERRRTLLIAILRLFEHDDLEILRAAFNQFGAFSFTKAQLEKRAGLVSFRNAASFSNAFDNAHERSKRYPITVNDVDYRVLQLVPRRTAYQVGLISLARGLASGPVAEEDIFEDVKTALDRRGPD